MFGNLSIHTNEGQTPGGKKKIIMKSKQTEKQEHLCFFGASIHQSQCQEQVATADPLLGG